MYVLRYGYLNSALNSGYVAYPLKFSGISYVEFIPEFIFFALSQKKIKRPHWSADER